MSGELFPTKTRLALLRDVANSQVMADLVTDPIGSVILLFPDAPTSWEDREVVTARIRELERAGWVAESGVDWALTAAGVAVLDAHRGGRS